MKRKPTATVIIGPPATGKSTFAREAQKLQPEIEIFESDLVREQLYGARDKFWSVVRAEQDSWKMKGLRNLVNTMHNSKIDRALRDGRDIIIADAGSIFSDQRKKIRETVFRAGGQVKYMVVGRDVPFEELVARDKRRPADQQVGAKVLQEFHSKFQSHLPDILEEVGAWNWRPNLGEVPQLNSFTVFDIDGTLAEMTSRGPFDWKKVYSDSPRYSVTKMARDIIIDCGASHVMFWSGRDSVCRKETLRWLKDFVHPYITDDQLRMRPKGSFDPDWLVKHRIMLEVREERGLPALILDDRQQVVDLWTNAGLQVWQVQQANF